MRLIDYEEHAVVVRHVGQHGDVTQLTAVIRACDEHCRCVRICFTCGFELVRRYPCGDVVILIRFRTDIHRVDTAEAKSAESGMVRVAAEYEFATDRHARDDGSHEARAGAVHEQLRMAYAIQLCVVVHHVTQSAARAEQRVRSGYLSDVPGDRVLQQSSVARLFIKRAPALVPRHVERHIVLCRVLH